MQVHLTSECSRGISKYINKLKLIESQERHLNDGGSEFLNLLYSFILLPTKGLVNYMLTGFIGPIILRDSYIFVYMVRQVFIQQYQTIFGMM
jgi:hypothetical protein